MQRLVTHVADLSLLLLEIRYFGLDHDLLVVLGVFIAVTAVDLHHSSDLPYLAATSWEPSCLA